jgi:hypothetical protein
MSIHVAIPRLFRFGETSSAPQVELEPNRSAYDEHALHDGHDGHEHGEAEAIRVLYRFEVG